MVENTDGLQGFENQVMATDDQSGDTYQTVEADIAGLKKDTGIDDIHKIIKRIALLPDELEHDSLTTKLSKATGIQQRTIRKKLEKYAPKAAPEEMTDGIVIAHPSYEVNHLFLSLGFKETVIIADAPATRDIFIISHPGGIILAPGPVCKIGEEKIIFDMRERILCDLADRWSKTGIQKFQQNPVSPTGLYHEIKQTLQGYIEFPNDAIYGLISSWIIATYFHRCFHAFPFLFFYGKKQCGKSRGLDILMRLCFNAFKTRGISVASMSDSIDGVRATLLMDQAESLSDKNNVDILGILADSYTPEGGKRRIVQITQKSRKVVEFCTYAPKAFASIKEIDSDLKDRCIEINMVRAEREYPYPEAFLPIWGKLRDKLYRLALTRWQDVKAIYETAGADMTQRVRELWRPIDTILTLENVPPVERNSIKAFFLESMTETQAGLSEGEELLFDAIRDLLGYREEAVFTVSEIADKIPLPEGAKVKSHVTWTGKAIKKLALFTRYEGKKDNKKHHYLFTRSKIENIFNRYQISGLSGEVAKPLLMGNLLTATEIIEVAEGGGNSHNAATYSHIGKTGGSSETLDNRHYSHLATSTTEIISTEININDDDNDFIDEIEE
ncbi:MAG: hypothetical protein C0392_05795 [Syntrophus sp. (in: bacteria)]|nr:hypothetical protein [Syntrophus sp. (in: bacteria)]